MVYIDDVEPGFEQIEDGLDRLSGDSILDVFEVREEHDVLCRLGMSVWGYNNDRYGPSFDQVEGIAAHKNLAEAGGSRNAHDDELYIVVIDIFFQGVEEPVAFFRYQGYTGAGNGGYLCPDALQGELHDGFSSCIFFLIGAQGAAIGAILQGIKDIIEYHMGVWHQGGDMGSIAGCIPGGFGKVDRNKKIIHM